MNILKKNPLIIVQPLLLRNLYALPDTLNKHSSNDTKHIILSLSVLLLVIRQFGLKSQKSDNTESTRTTGFPRVF